jgi:small conductance mechanosensitive channel
MTSDAILSLLQSAAISAITLIIGWIAAGYAHRVASSAMMRSKLDEALARFFASMLRYTILAAVFLSAAESVGINITSMMAIFASAGLAVGLALQGSLTHFASGVLLLFFRPFTIGDKVTAGGHTGTVTEIGLFATTLNLPNGTTIVVPNAGITQSSICNITGNGRVRGTVEIGVAYGTDLGQAQAVLARAASESPLVLTEPSPPEAYLASFGASSIDYAVHCWSTPEDHLAMLADVRKRVYDALNAEGIDIPFQTVTVLNPPS